MSRACVRVGLTVALLGSTWAASAAGGDRPRVAALELDRREDRLAVSFALENALDDELRERIHSGIPLRFRHRVELGTRRGFPLWTWKVLDRIVIDTEVAYDSLTRQYELTRKAIEPASSGADPELERRTTTSTSEMVDWMTELEDLPAFDLSSIEPGTKLRVQVESALGRRYLLWLIPSRVRVSAERELFR